MFQPRQGADESVLNLLRKRGRKPVQVHLLAVDSLRLDEYLMPVPVREAHDLVLYRRTVARSPADNLAAVERRAVHVLAYDPVSLLIRPGNITVQLRPVDAVIVKAERKHLLITFLDFQLVKVER